MFYILIIRYSSALVYRFFRLNTSNWFVKFLHRLFFFYAIFNLFFFYEIFIRTAPSSLCNIHTNLSLSS